MTDREKVISELAVMAWNHDGEQRRTLLNAIALLVGSEPIPVMTSGSKMIRCDCGTLITYRGLDRCPMCGREVLWND